MSYVNVKVCKDDGFSQSVDKVLYQSLVGILLYTAIATRPEISYAVGIVAQVYAGPNQSHLTTAKHILRYLKGTAQHALVYKRILILLDSLIPIGQDNWTIVN